MSTSRQLADWNKTWPKVGENYTITQIYWTHYPNQCPICRQQVTADTVAEARLQTCQKAIEGVGENLKKGSLQTSQKGINPIFNVVHLSAVNLVICNGSQLIIVWSWNHIYWHTWMCGLMLKFYLFRQAGDKVKRVAVRTWWRRWDDFQKLVEQVACLVLPRILQIHKAGAGSVRQEKVKMRQDGLWKGGQTTSKSWRTSDSSGPTSSWISRLTRTRSGRKERKFADKSKRYWSHLQLSSFVSCKCSDLLWISAHHFKISKPYLLTRMCAKNQRD